MDKPGYRYAISAPREKRSALAGEMVALRQRMVQCEKELAHIDASLRLLAPGADPTACPSPASTSD